MTNVSIPKTDDNLIVRVDRSVRPTYPKWMEKKVMHPELELVGPTEYDLSQVEQWFHGNQNNSSVPGDVIYKHLQKGNGLATCLNLQDARAIQQKNIAVFRKLFASKVVFFWGSVVQDCDNGGSSLRVPCLHDYRGKIELAWNWLDIGRGWSSNDPALRFSK